MSQKSSDASINIVFVRSIADTKINLFKINNISILTYRITINNFLARCFVIITT